MNELSDRSHEYAMKDSLILMPTRNIYLLRESFKLVYEQYRKRGYTSENNCKMRYSLLDLLPCTTTFVAHNGSSVVGTISAVLYTPAGLPSSFIFDKVFNKSLDVGKKFGEGTKLACHDNILGKNSARLSRELIKCLYHWGLSWQLNQLFIVANPRHSFFWSKVMGFDTASENSTCSHVEGNPGILYSLNTDSHLINSEKLSKVAYNIYSDKNLPSGIFKNRDQLCDDDVYELLKESPELVLRSNRILLEQLQFYFPSASRRIQNYLKRQGIYTVQSNSINLSQHLDYVLDSYDNNVETFVYPMRPEAAAFRRELSDTIQQIERQGGAFVLNCSVADDIPDNLIFDISLLRSIIQNITFYLHEKVPNSSLELDISTDEVGIEESCLKFRFAARIIDPPKTELFPPEVKSSLKMPLDLRNIQSRLRMMNSRNLTIQKNKNNLIIRFSLNFMIHEGNIFHHRPQINMNELQPEKSSEGLKILLAEDNYVNQLLVKRVLEKLGHVVKIAGNGQECLDQMELESFDCVIMDCQMPQVDGFEATKKIRQAEISLGKRTPIIALTAYTLRGDMQRCLDSGMDAYLAKPLHVSSMLRTLREVTGRTNKNIQNKAVSSISCAISKECA